MKHGDSFARHRGPSIVQVHDYSADRSPYTLIIGFALIIFVGTVLLMLPIATENHVSLDWREALFTATSAVTVTGLVVVSTVERLSTFGELVVLGLIQVGGLGFVILSVLLLRLIGRRVAMRERIILRQTMGVRASHGILDLALAVVVVVVGIELIGAVILFFTWWDDMGAAQAAYYAVFHSISAFCNAGFDLFHGTDDPHLLATRSDAVASITMATLITSGTMGITAVFDLLTFPKTRRLSLHTSFILPLLVGMTVIGTTILLLDEAFYSDVLSTMPWGERILAAFFTVVSSRTAGITLLPINELGQASQLILMVFMFIGGAPASMGGGIGLTTIAVVLVTLYNNVRGHPDIRVRHRTLPVETIQKAIAIVTVSTILVLSVVFAILLLDGGDMVAVGFEVISAFSNTGYSLGITSDLNQISRGLLIFTMFWGRLGPLTLVVALAQRNHQRTQVRFPEEKIIIG